MISTSEQRDASAGHALGLGSHTGRLECRGTAVGAFGSEVSEYPDSDEATTLGTWLKCKQCGNRIARTSDRIEMSGQHAHTFINPLGVIYKIGCFQSASGAIQIGPASADFTWFAGYEWRVVCCGGCDSHVGWAFASRMSQFFALILAALIENENTVEPA